jgi:hypothetical protein
MVFFLEDKAPPEAVTSVSGQRRLAATRPGMAGSGGRYRDDPGDDRGRDAAWVLQGRWQVVSLSYSRREAQQDAGRAVRGDCAAVGQELAGVIEQHDAVAQQAPPLLGVEGDGAGRVTVRVAS